MAVISGSIVAGVAAVGTVGGAIAGAIPDEEKTKSSTQSQTQQQGTTSEQSSSSTTQQGTSSSQSRNETLSGLRLGDSSALEQQARQNVGQSYNDLSKIAGLGPGESDIIAGSQASRDLASLLSEYQRTGGVPSAEDQAAAGQYANSVFGARQVELEQDFRKQTTDTQRLAAQLGRSVDDPVLQAKLKTGMMDQQARLTAEKSGFASQFARDTSQNRLNYATQRTGLMNNLASQAFQNRAALLAAGSDILGAERNFRVQTAQQYGTSTGSQSGQSSSIGTSQSQSFGQSNSTSNTSGTTTGTNISGGGLGGAIKGGLAGFGTGLSAGTDLAAAFNENKIALGPFEQVSASQGVPGQVYGQQYA